MKFADLLASSDRFRTLLKSTTGRDLIAQVSLDVPTGSSDEISFYKLVLWSCAFWNEACQPAGRHVLSIVKNTSISEYKVASGAFATVQNLRTVLAHNLNPVDKGDQRKAEQARIWLLAEGGDPPNWATCISSLCSSMTAALTILADRWETISGSPEDAAIGVQRLTFAMDREWPGHIFDRMIEQAAAKHRLSGLDPVAFRDPRLAGWRKLSEMFATREDAEIAVQRAITQELSGIFGGAQPLESQ